MQQQTPMIYMEKGGYETMKVREGLSRLRAEQKQNAVGISYFSSYNTQLHTCFLHKHKLSVERIQPQNKYFLLVGL